MILSNLVQQMFPTTKLRRRYIVIKSSSQLISLIPKYFIINYLKIETIINGSFSILECVLNGFGGSRNGFLEITIINLLFV